MHNDRRVVITGIGPISTLGIGRQLFWENLLALKEIMCPIPSSFEKSYSYKSKFYVPFPEFDIKDFGIPGKYNNLMGETAQLAVVGTRLALEDAGFTMEEGIITPSAIMDKAQIILGVGVGNVRHASYAYLVNSWPEIQESVQHESLPVHFNRMTVPIVMHNSASSWVSILYGIKGTNYTINSSCSSGTYAIGEAFRKVKAGDIHVAITGGVECMVEKYGTYMRSFDVLGTLTRAEDGKPMPFSKKRSGFLFSEGAGCILVLEELKTALKRGVAIYAEIVDFNANSDAYNIVQIEPSGSQIKQLIEETIKDRKIDYMNSHGTGTLLNDETEAKVIKEIFGSKKDQPVINSTKGILGHSIGASGALEIAVTALSIDQSRIHANLMEEPMEDLNLNLETQEIEINYALSTSYGFGGHNSAILLQKYKNG